MVARHALPLRHGQQKSPRSRAWAIEIRPRRSSLALRGGRGAAALAGNPRDLASNSLGREARRAGRPRTCFRPKCARPSLCAPRLLRTMSERVGRGSADACSRDAMRKSGASEHGRLSLVRSDSVARVGWNDRSATEAVVWLIGLRRPRPSLQACDRTPHLASPRLPGRVKPATRDT